MDKAPILSDPTVILQDPGWRRVEGGNAWFWSAFPGPIPASLRQESWTFADLGSITGHWALVDLRGPRPALAMDRVRSRPLLAARAPSGWIITDTVEALRGRIPFIPSTEATTVFRHTAFSLEDATLLQSVWDVQVGSVMYLGDRPETRFYFCHRFADDRIDDPSEYAGVFARATDVVMERLLDQVGGRQLVVPLSGGLDSRMMMAWLHKLGAKNVLAFSYGKPNAEGGIAQAVAEDMGYPYTFVEYDPREMRRVWESDESESFIRTCWSGTSLPHVQDWWALNRLVATDRLDGDAVFLPGHTIVGAMHDDGLLGTEPAATDLAGALAHHHGNLQGQYRTFKNNPSFVRSVRESMRQVQFDGTDRGIHELFEWYNFKERQAKYINNSLRAYEHFGFSWALPFYDLEFWRAWQAGSQEFTATRRWYGDFVDTVFRQQGGRQFPTYDPRTSVLRSFVDSRAGRALAGNPIAGLLNGVRDSEYAVNHPLGFEAFNGKEPRILQRWRAFGGVHPLGMWADAMLAGTWGAGVQLFDQPVPTKRARRL